MKHTTKLSKAPSVLLLASLALAACTPANSDYFTKVNPTAPAALNDSCGASAYQHLVGQPLTALASVTIPDPKRIIEPGSAVTMDFVAERLDIRLDVTDHISDITCG